jgi:hypothetical protein
MIGNSPAVLMNFNQLSLKLNQFLCNSLPVLPDHQAKANQPVHWFLGDQSSSIQQETECMSRLAQIYETSPYGWVDG